MPANLIFLNRLYHPDHAATSQMLFDLASGLAGADRRVTVITSRTETREGGRLAQREQVNGVDVIRASVPFASSRGGPKRLVSALAFHASAAIKILRLARRGDIIIAKTDPPLIGLTAYLAGSLRGSRTIHWLQDVFPEVAAELHVSTLTPGLSRLLSILRNASWKGAAALVPIGDQMARRVRDVVAPDQVVVTIPNWFTETSADTNSVRDEPARERSRNHNFIVGYSGNLGRSHPIEAVVDAARQLEGTNIAFEFTGGGTNFKRLRSTADRTGLSNVHFFPFVERSQLLRSLRAADAHLVILDPCLESLIVPSKFYGILAAGRPVIFVGDVAGELSSVITAHRVGIVVDANDSTALVRAITELRDNPGEAEAMGHRARDLFESDYTFERALQAWNNLLT